jgi:hypothetical protein
MSYKDMARIRGHHRAQDLAESQAILLELGASEPTLQQCFKIIESTCLSQGICCLVDGKECTARFQNHVDTHYTAFLKESLRAMVIFGFVPWRLRRLDSGDKVPEVMPLGTFDWHTELGPTQEQRHQQHYHQRKRKALTGTDDDTRLVIYRVVPTVGDVKEEDVQVYIHTPPALNISANSVMNATVSSPISHVLTDYKNLRNAQIRRSYADAWNTTAQLISTFKPGMIGNDDPTSALMDFMHESNFKIPHVGQSPYPQLEAHNWFERDILIRKQIERPSTHRPQVYTLPRDHDLVQQVMLSPCEDLQFLSDKFRRDICSATGVPYEMVSGKEGGGSENTKKTMASGRIFSVNMHEFCRHCQNLLRTVYCHVYRVEVEAIEFILTPMPRLEVESVADLKILFEIGALTPDMSVELSKILLGNAARPSHWQSKTSMRDGEAESKPHGVPDSVMPGNGNSGSKLSSNGKNKEQGDKKSAGGYKDGSKDGNKDSKDSKDSKDKSRNK